MKEKMMRVTTLRSIVLAVLIGFFVLPASDVQILARSQPQQKPQQQAPQQQPPQQQQPAQKEKQKPEYTLSIEAPAVNVDVVVTNEHGDILTGFKKDNFRISDNGVPQTISNFGPSENPITMVMLVEYSNLFWGWYAAYAQYWGYGFVHYLKPQDWIALVTYDLRSRIDVDFTQNKEEVKDAIAHLGFPGFHEANFYDALLDTLDRLQEVKGKKSILVLATGLDTFSKHTYDQTLKRLKQTEVTIFCVNTAEPIMNYRDATGNLSTLGRMDYLQAKNAMSTFSGLTGGFAWFPRFDGELPAIFENVGAFLRNQYSLAYTPANVPMDGKYHKIKVDVVGNDGQPFVLTNQKGKKMKIKVYAREGYEAPKTNAGD
jgi:Ca-activated chloride channel homolog